MKREIITSVDPKSPVSELFRTLRTNLQYLNKKDGAQTILLTSTLQGEGKSFVAANLAVTFAQTGKNVVLVDTDMRRPRQHKIFSVNMYPGLSNYLSGVDINRGSHRVSLQECVYQSKVENLFVLPAGNIPPNPSELLQSEKLIGMIDELKECFDIVVFDGAPCLLVTDATLVSRLVDATLLVVSQKRAKIDDLKEVKNRIKRVGGNLVGVVLNRVKVSNKKYGDKYYYSSASVREGKNAVRGNKKSKSFDDEVEVERIVERKKIEEENFNNISTTSYKNKKKANRNINSTNDKLDKKEETNNTTKQKNVDFKIKDKKIEKHEENDTGSEKIQEIMDEIKKLKEDK